MITIYQRIDGRLVRGGPELLTDAALWIDLLSPTPEEERAVEALIGIDVPTREEMQEIEVSSRLARDGDILTMTAPVLTNSTGFNPENVAITFILTNARLITVRYGTPQGLAAYIARLERHPVADGAGDLLLGMIESLVDRIADVLEMIAQE
ncbi:MAG: Mg2+ and Co2+ transporter, partial [Magnetospirillum sp.]|nr:Mg2+ and Co2+ transporter [Magnetospirillum sp.]